jgi:cytochrome P450
MSRLRKPLDCSWGESLATLFMMASNTYSLIPNALGGLYWTVFEVFRRPELVERLRPIFESVLDRATGDIDSVKLSRDPLLQSIMAEVLRMRVQGIVLRTAKYQVELEGWKFPKDAYLMAPTHFGNSNENVWNTGTPDSPHPLDTFWAERFLVYPDRPDSGPSRRAQSTITQSAQASDPSSSGPRYSEQGLKGAYFPFGAHVHPCSGRQFSQYEIINILAILVLNYDIEFCIEPGWAPKMRTKVFGLGTLPPAEKLPFRIRRRCAS